MHKKKQQIITAYKGGESLIGRRGGEREIIAN